MKKYLLVLLLLSGCSGNTAEDLEKTANSFLDMCKDKVDATLTLGNKGNSLTYTCTIDKEKHETRKHSGQIRDSL